MHTRDGHRPATQRCEEQRGITRGLTGERVGGAAGRVAGVELGSCACVWWSSVAPVLVAGVQQRSCSYEALHGGAGSWAGVAGDGKDGRGRTGINGRRRPSPG
jgi:hypothetical protein